MKKVLYILFTALFIAVCITPLAFMKSYIRENPLPLANETPAVWPLDSLKDFNSDTFSGISSYVDQHFAFRYELITANSTVLAKTLHVSGSKAVVLGKDGWLFFGKTVNDYTGKATMDARQIRNIHRNLQLIREGVEKKGCRFYFTIAPNKNSLYGQYMPYFYKQHLDTNNYSKLKPYLGDVNYIDMYRVFRGTDRTVYHKLDSHWNNEGALMAHNAIMKATGRTYDDYSGVTKKTVKNHDGDLYPMIYPKGSQKDYNVEYARRHLFTYDRPVRNNDDILIDTSCTGKTGSLVMFRDSFGIALLPYMADEYGRAEFSKVVPYDIAGISSQGSADVVLEIVERNLGNLCSTAPVMDAPQRKQISGDRQLAASTAVTAVDMGQRLKLSGDLGSCVRGRDADIFIEIDQRQAGRLVRKTYEPFYIGDTKFEMYVPGTKVSAIEHIYAFTGNKGNYKKVELKLKEAEN
jgi:hypothetical protein